MAHEDATDEDIARMRDIVREAVEAGAIGFSTGRSDNHRSADGDPTPASEAAGRELSGIAEAFALPFAGGGALRKFCKKKLPVLPSVC